MNHNKNPITILFIMNPPPGLKPMVYGKGKPEGMPTIYKLLQGLVDTGHRVCFLSVVDPEEQVELGGKAGYLLTSGMHLYLLKLPQGKLFSPLMRGNTPISRFFWYVRRVYQTLFFLLKFPGIIRKIKPDIIYAGIKYQFLGGLIGKLKHIPTILRFYGVHLLYNLIGSWRAFLEYPKEVLALKIPSECVIITNDGTRGDEVARFYGVPESRLKFWINGVDKDIYQPDFARESFLNRLGIPPQKRVVLTLCRLVDWKRVDQVIRAAPEVVQKINNVVFLIVGDGPERHNLELLAQQLKLNSRVRFYGVVSHNEVSDFMNVADIFVSLHDLANLPVPLLEAMSCGKCIISIDDGALDGLIENGKNGILVKPYLVHTELPSILVGLLSDDSKRQQLGKNAWEFAMNNLETWDERIIKEIRLIEEIVQAYKLKKKVK